MQITQLVDMIKKRESDTRVTIENLNSFSHLLFDCLVEILDALQKEGITIIEEVKRERLQNNFEKLSFIWEGERLIFVSSEKVALPVEHGSEAYKNLIQRKDTGMAGRLVVFAQPLDEHLDGFALHNYYVFNDKSWFSYGANSYPRYETSIDTNNIFDEAIRFIATLSKKNNRTWKKLANTNFEQFIKNIYSQIDHVSAEEKT